MNDVLFKDYDSVVWRIDRMFNMKFIDDQKYSATDTFRLDYAMAEAPAAIRYGFLWDL